VIELRKFYYREESIEDANKIAADGFILPEGDIAATAMVGRSDFLGVKEHGM
jgi:hypothetical protein